MSLNTQTCKRCGRLFNYLAGDRLCPVCKEEMEVKFHEVKDFIKEHENVTIAQVSEECNVQPTWIQKWLREERLELTEGSAITLDCESCGAPIRSGRLCNKCAANLRSAAGDYIHAHKAQAETPLVRSDSARMRFIQND